jgi:hypothetical protein
MAPIDSHFRESYKELISPLLGSMLLNHGLLYGGAKKSQQKWEWGIADAVRFQRSRLEHIAHTKLWGISGREDLNR